MPRVMTAVRTTTCVQLIQLQVPSSPKLDECRHGIEIAPQLSSRLRASHCVKDRYLDKLGRAIIFSCLLDLHRSDSQISRQYSSVLLGRTCICMHLFTVTCLKGTRRISYHIIFLKSINILSLDYCSTVGSLTHYTIS